MLTVGALQGAQRYTKTTWRREEAHRRQGRLHSSAARNQLQAGHRTVSILVKPAQEQRTSQWTNMCSPRPTAGLDASTPRRSRRHPCAAHADPGCLIEVQKKLGWLEETHNAKASLNSATCSSVSSAASPIFQAFKASLLSAPSKATHTGTTRERS